MSLDEQKKQILPYLQRAQELQKVDPKVAYYCRYYAISQGLKIQNREKAITDILGVVMGELEKSKATIQLDEKEDGPYCEQFAVNIFNKAEKVDLSGNANEVTSKTYYAAGIFIDICRQFFEEGQFPEDLEQKQKFALWRATEIRKAIREGREPTPINNNQNADNQGLQNIQEVQVARFVPGNKVLYRQDPSLPPQPGTVGMVVSTEGMGDYKVALQQDVVLASGDELAYQLNKGDIVLYTGPDGSQNEATIVQVDMSMWKPSYIIRLENGSERSTEEHKLSVSPQQQSQQQQQQQSEQQYYQQQQNEEPAVVPPPIPFEDAQQNSVRSDDQQQEAAVAPPIPPPEVPHYPNPYGAQPQQQYTPQPSHQQYPAQPIQQQQQYPSQPMHQPQSQAYPVPQQYAAPQQQQYPQPSAPQAPAAFQPSLKSIVEAQKKAKSASSALSFDDVPTAIKHLTEALNLLTQPVPKSTPGFSPTIKEILDAQKCTKSAASALGSENIANATKQMTQALLILTNPQKS